MTKRAFSNTLFIAIAALVLFGFAGNALADKNYSSSLSNTKLLQINQEIGDTLLSYGLGDTEINQVTEHLSRGISQDDLQTLLREMGLKDADIKEALTKFDKLGIKIDAKLLPTSRWYFLKEWWRWIQRVFTFNKIAKAELELKITNEKTAELLKVQETKPDDANAFIKALANYK